MGQLVKFPPEHQSLLAEVARHPTLKQQLKQIKPKDISEYYGAVAAYCEIILDGMYDAKDFPELARTLTDKLYQKRTLVVYR